MSENKNGGLDQYGTEPFKQQQFRTAGVEWAKTTVLWAEKFKFGTSQHTVNVVYVYHITSH